MLEEITGQLTNLLNAIGFAVVKVATIYIVLPYFVVGVIFYTFGMRGKKLHTIASLASFIGLLLFLKYGIEDIHGIYASKVNSH